MVDGLMKRRLGEVVPCASAGAAAPVTAAAVTTLARMSRRDVAPRSGRVGPRGDRASSIMTSPPLIIPDRQAWRGLAARLSIRYPDAPVFDNHRVAIMTLYLYEHQVPRAGCGSVFVGVGDA